MKRRQFLFASLLMPLAAAFARQAAAATGGAGGKSLAEIQSGWKSLLARNADVTLSTEPLKKTPAEWKQVLNPAQFNVLREEGTERPGSSPLNAEKRAGVFVCAGCTLPLFTSAMKYESGTGWPSFFTSIPGHLGTSEDSKLFYTRTEYHCIRCGGHQGHVFDDGPLPTHQRWCNNGVALKFIPA